MGKFFEEPYYKELVKMSKQKYGVDELTSEMKDRVDSVYREQLSKMNDVTKHFKMPFYGNGEGDFKYIKTMNNMLEKEDAIFSFNGIFKKEKSFIAYILEDASKDRGKFKKMMLEERAKGNEKGYKLYDSFQKFKKEVMNSIYGVLGLHSFFLFNLLTASSITGDCSNQLQILITQVEKTYGGRVILRDYIELTSYLLNNMIDADESKVSEYYQFFNLLDKNKFYNFDHDALLERLSGYCQFDLDSISEAESIYLSSIIEEILSNPVQKFRFYFLNDVKTFLESSDRLENLIRSMADNVCSLEGFKEKEFTKTMDNEFKDIFIELLVDKFIQHDCDYLCCNFERTTVMMSDTDSLFVKSPTLTNLLANTITSVVDITDRQDLDVFTFRLLSYLGGAMFGFLLNKLTTEVHNSGENVTFEYKSEFFYPKLLLLPAKKTYIGLCTVQEGYKIPPFVDEKNIKKTSYTKPSTDFVLDLCSNFIDVNKEFSYAETFNTVEKHKDNVRDLIRSGSTLPGTPFKFKQAREYADPYSQSNFIGGEFYNILYPYNKLPSGSPCNSVELLLPDNLTKGKNLNEEENAQIIADYYKEYLPENMSQTLDHILLGDGYPEMRDVILRYGGIPYIGIPKGSDIPDYLIELIDIEKMVQKNIDIRSVNFLNAVGIHVDSSSRGDKITNIISF